jgi:hypothetical protein
MRDDAEGVSLAMQVGKEGTFRGVYFIPRSMITEVIDLGTPRGKRRPTCQNAPEHAPEVGISTPKGNE